MSAENDRALILHTSNDTEARRKNSLSNLSQETVHIEKSARHRNRLRNCTQGNFHIHIPEKREETSNLYYIAVLNIEVRRNKGRGRSEHWTLKGLVVSVPEKKTRSKASVERLRPAGTSGKVAKKQLMRWRFEGQGGLGMRQSRWEIKKMWLYDCIKYRCILVYVERDRDRER